MSVYVDDYRAPYRGLSGRIFKMSHMMADTPEELHAMADRLGLKRSWFQGDHYDVVEAKRIEAIKLGAIACTPMDCVRVRQKWRSEKLGKWSK